jgi:hypothetical protein
VYDHAILPGWDEQWTTLTPLPAGGRAGGGLVYLAGAQALLFAGGAIRPMPGLPDAVDEPDTWMMNLNDDVPVWTKQPDLPYLSNHTSYTSAVDDFGTVHYYFVAGQIGENEVTGNVNDHYEWDMTATPHDWIERASMPFPRGHASSSTFGIG